jgi:hypothetical protein
VEAFAGEVRQVLLNLVRNSCEAITRPGGTVTVELKGSEEGVDVAVIDQGAGIDPGILPNLFQFGDHQGGPGQWDWLVDGEAYRDQASWPGGCALRPRARNARGSVVAAALWRFRAGTDLSLIGFLPG